MAIRVEVAGTTKVKKITRGPGSGTTIVKTVTVGAPNRIGEPTIGAIRTLDDVNGQVNQGEGTYLRFDSAAGIYLHRPFDSDVSAIAGNASINGLAYSADSGILTATTGAGDSYNVSILTEVQRNVLNNEGNRAGITWSKSGTADQFRTASGYVDSDKQDYTIRSMNFTSDLLRLELAFFSPEFTITGQSLYWDESATQFTVSVDNPGDFLARFIDSVSDINQLSGSVHGTIGNYTAGAKSATPAGGVDFTQTFSTVRSLAEILSTTSTLTGGSASASLTFNEDSNTVYTTDSFSTNWLNASLDLSASSLTGNTFLQTYSSVPYTLTKSGVSDSSAHSATITPTGGTLSNDSASGIFTFTDPIHKDNNTGRSLAATCDFVRAAGISTAGQYTAQDSANVTSLTASFTFPSFWMFTAAVGSPPSSADIVDGTVFDAATVGAQLGDQVKNLSASINNPSASPQALWFGVRTAASQPTTFQTGSSSTLLSDVSVTTGSVNIQPDTPPGGYSAEAYSLYGITLQPGDTFVSIS